MPRRDLIRAERPGAEMSRATMRTCASRERLTLGRHDDVRRQRHARDGDDHGEVDARNPAQRRLMRSTPYLLRLDTHRRSGQGGLCRGCCMERPVCDRTAVREKAARPDGRTAGAWAGRSDRAGRGAAAAGTCAMMRQCQLPACRDPRARWCHSSKMLHDAGTDFTHA